MPRERNQFGRLHTGIESTFSADGREIEESITTLQRGRSKRFHWGLIFRRWVKIKLLPDEEASIGHHFSKNTRNPVPCTRSLKKMIASVDHLHWCLNILEGVQSNYYITLLYEHGEIPWLQLTEENTCQNIFRNLKHLGFEMQINLNDKGYP
jgi:hypothetical protein